MEHWFGLRVSDDIETAWGARTIATRSYGLDFVWDRMQKRGHDAGELCGWIDNDVRPLLQTSYMGKQGYDLRVYLALQNNGKDAPVVAIDEGDFHFRASTNSSHGYVYMCAFVGDAAQAQAWDDAAGGAGRQIVRFGQEG